MAFLSVVAQTKTLLSFFLLLYGTFYACQVAFISLTESRDWWPRSNLLLTARTLYTLGPEETERPALALRPTGSGSHRLLTILRREGFTGDDKVQELAEPEGGVPPPRDDQRVQDGPRVVLRKWVDHPLHEDGKCGGQHHQPEAC